VAVFTPVTPEQVDRWLEAFEVGRLVRLEGIGEGIENSNFFVTTSNAAVNGGEFVLTLFERLSEAQLPFYLEFMRTAADAGVAVPAPIADRSGRILHRLADKPCCLATRLSGRFVEHPKPAHCKALGVGIAQLHAAGASFEAARPSLMQPNLRGLSWWREVAPQVRAHLAAELLALFDDELGFQIEQARARDSQPLPSGPVHADIFRNNVLFDDAGGSPRLGGFIDFYFAGVDLWLFDLAVAVNDWCIDLDTGVLDHARADALLGAYASKRRFEAAERDAWHAQLRAAAFRFWVSRLYDYHLPRTAQTLTPHDPGHFQRVLQQRRIERHSLPD
jgi:homoserine kinase type II